MDDYRPVRHDHEAQPGTPGRGAPSAAAGLLSRPQYRVVALGVLALLVLLGLLGAQLYRVAWQDAWREVNDKHRVLAVNLANAVAGHVRDRRYTIASVAAGLSSDVPLRERLAAGQGAVLDAFRRGVDGIRSLTLLDRRGRLLHAGDPDQVTPAALQAMAECNVFYNVLSNGGDYQAGVAASPFDGEPSVMLGWPVKGQGGRIAGVLLGELSTAPIEALRAQLRFGEGGHAMLVDQHGRVLAHPGAGWMREMRDMSDLPVVKAALTGASGVTEFHSPYADKLMVAGYAPVPGLGWAVIVPQPKSEIADGVRALLHRQLLWAGLGLGVLLLIAYLLALWVTRPLQRLAGGLEQPEPDEKRRDGPT